MSPGRSLGGLRVSLLIVDDHRSFAEVMAARLLMEPHIQHVELSFSVAMARTMMRRRVYDLVLLDLCLEGESGLDLLSAPRAGEHPLPPVLVLSGVSDVDRTVAALERGALGWVPKGSRVDILLDAVDRALQGRGFLPEAMLLPVIRRLMQERRSASVGQTFVDRLTPREREVLQCLVAGMTRAETAAHLFVSPNTIRTHVQNILNRAEVHSTVALVAMARQAGVTEIVKEEIS
ncbi:MAG: response regulator transcription factor [Nocardioidaceae bacterium]